jgi:HlyD family secretion protein
VKPLRRLRRPAWATPPRVAGAALALLGVILLLAVARPPTVPAYEAEIRDVSQSLVVAGRVRPLSRARLGASIVGTVREVRVEEGDRVQPGDLLLRLDDSEARAGVAQARAGLAEARAGLERLRVVERPAQAAAAGEARLEVEQAERDRQRMVALFEQGGTTRQVLEEAEQRLELARLRLVSAEAEVRSHAETGPATAAASAAVEQARGTLAAAEARLALTQVAAAVHGTVLVRQVEPGDAVQPGRVLLEVAVEGGAELVAYPDEQNLGGLRLGQPARASADAFPAESFAATVSRIAPAVDPQQGTVEVRFAVADPPPYLRPEMTVSVDIRLADRPRALVVPADAVREQGGQAWVLVVRDGRVESQAVRLGVRGDRYVEILDGLTPGDPVLPAGEEPDPGARVRTRPAGGV